MILITGDLHGELERFQDKQIKRLKKGDTLIVCGDFGFVWDHSQGEQKVLEKLGKKRYNILFVEGTHDNLSILSQYPEEQWNGGTVRRISGNLMKLERGSVYTIEGKTFFAFGGGESGDMDARQEGVSWWAEELPNDQEIRCAWDNLSACGNQVDYIISHEGTSKLRNFLSPGMERHNVLTDFFDRIAQEVTFGKWFFGCYHKDQKIPPWYHALFRGVEIIE